MIARLLGSGFVFFLAVWPATATKYNIADSTGTLSIEGFIETNGRTGVLSDSDIVSWSLTITGHGAPITLDKGSSTLSIAGRALSATEKSLIFDHREHPPYDVRSPDSTKKNFLSVFNLFQIPAPPRAAVISWDSADPRGTIMTSTPSFGISVFRPDDDLDIHQLVGRTGIKTIATAP